MRKKAAREPKRISKLARTLIGVKAKVFNKKRYAEKAEMKKKLKAYDEKSAKQKEPDVVPEGAIPAYLLDREG